MATQSMPAGFFDDIDAHLASRGLSDATVRFSVAKDDAMGRTDAVRWVEEGLQEGYTLVRYIIQRQASGEVLIDLAAIKPLDSSHDVEAVTIAQVAKRSEEARCARISLDSHAT